MMRVIWLFIAVLGLAYADDGLDQKESTIPVLDLQDYFRVEKKDAFIAGIADACHRVGFFALKNTGANQMVIDTLYDAMKEFYTHDLELKEQVLGTQSAFQRGYLPKGKEIAKGSCVGDFKEYYVVGRDISEQQAKAEGAWVNIWPEFMDFKTPATDFFQHLQEYALLIEEILSLALGEEANFLKEVCDNGDTTCRLIHYFGDTEKDHQDQDSVWSKAHTDIDMFTILPKATCEGLEIQDAEGNWIPVYVKEDAMIVNCGDFTEIFSNGYFKSVVHRVQKPANSTKDRYSSVHFVHPPSEQFLYPLQRWIDEAGEAKFIKATRWEMLIERLADCGLASDEMLKDLSDRKVLERLMTVGRASPFAMQALLDAGYASEEVKAELQKQQEKK